MTPSWSFVNVRITIQTAHNVSSIDILINFARVWFCSKPVPEIFMKDSINFGKKCHCFVSNISNFSVNIPNL